MRIAYVCADRGIPVFGGKGASVHVREITSALSRRGHEVHLCAARLGEGNPAPNLASLQLCESSESLEGALEGLVARGIDVFLERYSLQSGVARRVSRGAGAGHVLEVNAPLVVEASRWRGLDNIEAHLVAETRTFRDADAILAVSSALVDYVAERAPDVRVQRVFNGAETERIAAARPVQLGLDPESIVIGFTGSMKPWHGVLELLDAFEAVRRRHPNAVLVLAGSGPEESKVRARVDASATLRSSVRLLGAVAHRDIPAVLAAFDIGVAPYVPSDDFYFCPLKVIEYLAAGLPVVFPRLGDLEEIVGTAGIGYSPGGEGGLAAGLERLVVGAAARAECSERAMRRSAAFSWDRTAAAVEEVLEDTCARSGRAVPR